MKSHELDICMAVWYNQYLSPREFVHTDQICEQGYADLKFGGINAAMARKARRGIRGPDFVDKVSR